MICIGVLLLYLAISKNFEPLLLVPIGFGGILSNIPGVDIAVGQGVLHQFYAMGIETGIFPLVIFMGVGAMTDFGPLLANPKTLFLGAAAQFGIFATLMGAVALTETGLLEFSIAEAAAIGIIGGADGPTAIYVAGQLAPHLLGAIAVAAYSYMALVPLIQPPIMRLLTTEAERKIEMTQLREVSQIEKIVFPLLLLTLVAFFVPSAAPLLGMFCFGNLMRESGSVVGYHAERVNKYYDDIFGFGGRLKIARGTISRARDTRYSCPRYGRVLYWNSRRHIDGETDELTLNTKN